MAKQQADLDQLAQLCHILGDRTRLRILQLLQNDESNVTNLCNELKLPQPTVSRHLAILRMAGLAMNRRQGKEIFYSINESAGRDASGGVKTLTGGAKAIQVGPLVIGLSK